MAILDTTKSIADIAKKDMTEEVLAYPKVNKNSCELLVYYYIGYYEIRSDTLLLDNFGNNQPVFVQPSN
jgi:hypothetical protein